MLINGLFRILFFHYVYTIKNGCLYYTKIVIKNWYIYIYIYKQPKITTFSACHLYSHFYPREHCTAKCTSVFHDSWQHWSITVISSSVFHLAVLIPRFHFQWFICGVNFFLSSDFHFVIQEYVRNMSVAEIRDYMWNLLLALRHVHRANIIHRDIKPSNFLYNRKLKK